MIKLNPRYVVLPVIALVVIGSLPAPADSGRGGDRRELRPGIQPHRRSRSARHVRQIRTRPIGGGREDLRNLPQQHGKSRAVS
jgi:hypothetical protein